jgi:pimeloyl-ACP methyl ester carboxylesterase
MNLQLLHTETLNSDGFPLLLLHGWGQSVDSVKPLGELLTRSSQVHLIDLPGFGRSPAPEHAWSAFDYADRIIHYLDKKNIGQVDLAGHSFGGKVALCRAIRYPDRVRRLVRIATSGIRKQKSLVQKLRSFALKWSGKGLKLIDKKFKTELFTHHFAPRFGSPDYQKATGVMRSVLVRSVNEDLSPLLKKVKASTLLLWGEQDTETPFEIAHRLNQMIPGSRLIPLAHKGHYPFEGVGFHLCAYQITNFLGGADG